MYFAYLLYTVAVPPTPAVVEKNPKNAATLDDVSTDAGESDSEDSSRSSRSEEGSDESPSVRAGADDESSFVADACLDAVSGGTVYSRDLLLAFRTAPPPPPPGLEKPRAMYFTQPREESDALSVKSTRAGAWGGDHWSGYHAKQVRVKTVKSTIEKITTPKISPKATAVRPTPPWLNRGTVLQTFTA
jgi:hypothetical protein